MKKTLSYWCAFFCVFFCFSQTPDSLQIIKIPASYADRQGPPLSVKKDSLYTFGTADIYLVNKKSFAALKDLYENISNKNDMTSVLLDQYTNTLKENISLQDQLKTNFKSGDSLDKIGYQQAKSTLLETQKSLTHTINSLDKATNSLNEVEKNIKKQRRRTLFEKILIGFAGIGAGILVGISL